MTKSRTLRRNCTHTIWSSEMISRNYLITIALFAGAGIASYYIGHAVVRTPDDGVGLMVGGAAALLCFAVVRRDEPDRRFLLRLLAVALAARWLVGLALYYWHLRTRIGPDFDTYDHFGFQLLQSWYGLLDPNVAWLTRYTNLQRSGWGMYYYVAGVYYVLGRIPLIIQLINCALGAVVCVFVYRITWLVYPEQRVARLAAILAAVAPSMVLWTSQGLKEAPIVLSLSLCAFYTLKLCHRFTVRNCAWLLLALFILYALRHYAFYITFVATAGALLFTTQHFTPVRALQGMALVLILGLTFAYLGADETVQSLDLERLQRGRAWSARVANSGFSTGLDVTDTRSSLQFLPLGVLYVLFAPFPWMVKNLGQLLTLPEMVLWWLAAPLLARGYWFMLRHRFLASLPLTVFTIGLTLTYALFQSNAGTVHRQRTQLLVFFYIFISIGWEQWRQARRRPASIKRRVRAPLPYGLAGAAARTRSQCRTLSLETTCVESPEPSRL